MCLKLSQEVVYLVLLSWSIFWEDLGGHGEVRPYFTAVHLLYPKHPTCVTSLRLLKLFHGIRNNDRPQPLALQH